MQQHIERLMQSRIEPADDTSRKRGPPTEPTDGLDAAKRARLDAETPPIINVPPLPPGRVSFDQLFTLTGDSGLSSFDVKQLPPDLVVKIVVPLLARVDQSPLNQAVDVCIDDRISGYLLTIIGYPNAIPDCSETASFTTTARC